MDTSRVSWLVLERYFLDELPPSEKVRVELALEQSEDLHRCLEKIRLDADSRLRPLPDVAATAMPSTVPANSNHAARPRFWPRRDTWRGLLAAAATLVAVVGGWGIWNRAVTHPGERVKGGQVSLDLVRQSGGAVVDEASVFTEGDLFKVRVTCSHPGSVSWQVVVFQGEAIFFPLPSTDPLHCGNQVFLPGAFRLTGTAPAIVCFSLEEDIVSPERLVKEGIQALSPMAACTHTRPRSP